MRPASPSPWSDWTWQRWSRWHASGQGERARARVVARGEAVGRGGGKAARGVEVWGLALALRGGQMQVRMSGREAQSQEHTRGGQAVGSQAGSWAARAVQREVRAAQRQQLLPLLLAARVEMMRVARRKPRLPQRVTLGRQAREEKEGAVAQRSSCSWQS